MNETMSSASQYPIEPKWPSQLGWAWTWPNDAVASASNYGCGIDNTTINASNYACGIDNTTNVAYNYASGIDNTTESGSAITFGSSDPVSLAISDAICGSGSTVASGRSDAIASGTVERLHPRPCHIPPTSISPNAGALTESKVGSSRSTGTAAVPRKRKAPFRTISPEERLRIYDLCRRASKKGMSLVWVKGTQ